MPSQPSLQHEIKQSRPFRSVAQETTIALLRTSSLVRRALAHLVEPEGISLAQYNVLRILRGAGPAGLPTLAIRDRMVEEAPGITRLLDKLEAADYVRRVRAGQDRRQVMCHATDSALDLLARIDPHIDALEAALLGGLETDELTQLLALLARVREGPGRASSVER